MRYRRVAKEETRVRRQVERVAGQVRRVGGQVERVGRQVWRVRGQVERVGRRERRVRREVERVRRQEGRVGTAASRAGAVFIDNRIGMAASGSKDAAVPPTPGLQGPLSLPFREGAGPLREEARELVSLRRLRGGAGPGARLPLSRSDPRRLSRLVNLAGGGPPGLLPGK